MTGPRTIDVHAHCVPAGVVDRLSVDARHYGFEVVGDSPMSGLVIAGTTTRAIRPDLVDVDSRITAMDAMGVDVQLLSSWIDLTAYALPHESGIRYARMFNEELAQIVAEHPGRFRALCTVPLQSAPAAADELRYAVGELGMVGVEIATTVAGRDLDDPGLDPFWAVAEELGCLILLHPCAPLAGRGVSRYFLGNLVGNPAESTIAVGHLVFGGVLERHPGLKICVVHGGGFVPYQLGRWDHAYRRNARGAAVNLTRLPSEWASVLYYDTVLHSARSLWSLIETVGVSQVVLGSDFPFEMGDHRPRQLVEELPGLSGTERERILSRNLAGVLEHVALGGAA